MFHLGGYPGRLPLAIRREIRYTYGKKQDREGPSMKRIDKENYYLDIAQTVAGRSTCLRRCYGAIIVNNDCLLYTSPSPRD